MKNIFSPPFELTDLGLRLREQRKALGFSQAAAATALGVYRLTQMNYEMGKQSPPLEYLNAAATLGVDINYVLTGQRCK